MKRQEDAEAVLEKWLKQNENLQNEIRQKNADDQHQKDKMEQAWIERYNEIMAEARRNAAEERLRYEEAIKRLSESDTEALADMERRWIERYKALMAEAERQVKKERERGNMSEQQ
ncbi:MAG: hypothetical protein KJ737_18235 [Proteobacteria bacterium]|nr:hypothetical protein [Pseudomonadota bacterium]